MGSDQGLRILKSIYLNECAKTAISSNSTALSRPEFEKNNTALEIHISGKEKETPDNEEKSFDIRDLLEPSKVSRSEFFQHIRNRGVRVKYIDLGIKRIRENIHRASPEEQIRVMNLIDGLCRGNGRREHDR